MSKKTKMETKYFEWTDEEDALLSALKCLNFMLLTIPDLEAWAYGEAQAVKKKLKQNKFTKEELVDYVKQTTVDLCSNSPRFKNIFYTLK